MIEELLEALWILHGRWLFSNSEWMRKA